MADLSGSNRLALGLLRAPLSWWARPHVLPADLRRRYAKLDRPVCYVLNQLAAADLVVGWNAGAAHGRSPQLRALKRPRPPRSTLFLEKRDGFWGDRVDCRISAPMRPLVSAAVADPQLQVDVAPVTILWGRAPDKADSWL